MIVCIHTDTITTFFRVCHFPNSSFAAFRGCGLAWVGKQVLGFRMVLYTFSRGPPSRPAGCFYLFNHELTSCGALGLAEYECLDAYIAPVPPVGRPSKKQDSSLAGPANSVREIRVPPACRSNFRNPTRQGTPCPSTPTPPEGGPAHGNSLARP